MDNKDIKLIKLFATDLEELQQISRQTFFESFAAANTEENMRIYMDKSFSESKLRVEINNPGSEFYFAKLDNKAIGYCKINFGAAQTDINDSNALEIERIYVSKEFQGKKIGQILFEKIFEIAEQRGLDYIWLGVWDKNYRAVKFYERNGFNQFKTHPFMLGDEEQTDVLMKLVLHH